MSTFNFSGRVTGSAHHFGDGGQHVHYHGASDLGSLVRELRRQMAAATPRLPTDAEEAVEQLEAELESAEPNPGRLRRLIDRITVAAATTTAVAAAAEQVTAAIDRM